MALQHFEPLPHLMATMASKVLRPMKQQAVKTGHIETAHRISTGPLDIIWGDSINRNLSDNIFYRCPAKKTPHKRLALTVSRSRIEQLDSEPCSFCKNLLYFIF